MAVSRLGGDALRKRFGGTRVVRHAAWLTALVIGLALLSPAAPLALAFFALAGLTLGPIAPILLAGGGRADSENPGRGIAAVVSMAYIGLIAGPATVGFAAQATTLGTALGGVAGLALVIWAFSGAAQVADGEG